MAFSETYLSTVGVPITVGQADVIPMNPLPPRSNRQAIVDYIIAEWKRHKAVNPRRYPKPWNLPGLEFLRPLSLPNKKQTGNDWLNGKPAGTHNLVQNANANPEKYLRALGEVSITPIGAEKAPKALQELVGKSCGTWCDHEVHAALKFARSSQPFSRILKGQEPGRPALWLTYYGGAKNAERAKVEAAKAGQQLTQQQIVEAQSEGSRKVGQEARAALRTSHRESMQLAAIQEARKQGLDMDPIEMATPPSSGKWQDVVNYIVKEWKRHKEKDTRRYAMPWDLPGLEHLRPQNMPNAKLSSNDWYGGKPADTHNLVTEAIKNPEKYLAAIAETNVFPIGAEKAPGSLEQLVGKKCQDEFGKWWCDHQVHAAMTFARGNNPFNAATGGKNPGGFILWLSHYGGAKNEEAARVESIQENGKDLTLEERLEVRSEGSRKVGQEARAALQASHQESMKNVKDYQEAVQDPLAALNLDLGLELGQYKDAVLYGAGGLVVGYLLGGTLIGLAAGITGAYIGYKKEEFFK